MDMNHVVRLKNGKKVLVVDDSHQLRSVLAQLLVSKGYEVLQAEGGRNALDILRLQSVDLVISDIQMPNGDGFELLRDLRTSVQNCPPLILMSGNIVLSEPELKSLGVAHFLSKPFDSKEILSVVDSLTAEAA